MKKFIKGIVGYGITRKRIHQWNGVILHENFLGNLLVLKKKVYAPVMSSTGVYTLQRAKLYRKAGNAVRIEHYKIFHWNLYLLVKDNHVNATSAFNIKRIGFLTRTSGQTTFIAGD